MPRKLTADKVKRETHYFDSKEDATAFIAGFKTEREEHGKQAVTSEERRWIGFVKAQLGSLDILPDVIQHWRRTGPGAAASEPAREQPKRGGRSP